MKKLLLAVAMVTAMTQAQADLSEGQALVLGTAIGAAIASQQQPQVIIQPSPPVYYNGYREPHKFQYGTIPQPRYNPYANPVYVQPQTAVCNHNGVCVQVR